MTEKLGHVLPEEAGNRPEAAALPYPFHEIIARYRDIGDAEDSRDAANGGMLHACAPA